MDAVNEKETPRASENTRENVGCTLFNWNDYFHDSRVEGFDRAMLPALDGAGNTSLPSCSDQRTRLALPSAAATVVVVTAAVAAALIYGGLVRVVKS